MPPKYIGLTREELRELDKITPFFANINQNYNKITLSILKDKMVKISKFNIKNILRSNYGKTLLKGLVLISFTSSPITAQILNGETRTIFDIQNPEVEKFVTNLTNFKTVKEFEEFLKQREAEAKKNEAEKKKISKEFLYSGYLLEEIRNFNDAENFFKKSIEIDRNFDNVIAYADIKQIQNRFDEAKKLYKEALKLATNESQKAYVFNNLGAVNYKLNELNDAFSNFQEAHSIRRELIKKEPNNEQHKFNLANTLNNLGLLFYKLDRTEEALNYYLEAGNIYSKLTDKDPESFIYAVNLAKTSFNITRVIEKLGDYERALDGYIIALKIYEDLVSKNGKKILIPPKYMTDIQEDSLLTLGKVAYIYGKLKDYEIAMINYNMIDFLIKQYKSANVITPNIKKNLLLVLEDKFNLYREMKKVDYKKVISEHQEALKFAKDLSKEKKIFTLKYATILSSLAYFKAKHGDIEGARKNFQEALEISRDVILSNYPKKYQAYIDIVREYSNFLIERGEIKEAIELYKDVLSTIDKIKDKIDKKEYKHTIESIQNTISTLKRQVK